MEKLYRDAKIGRIYEGTSNIQLLTIAKKLLRLDEFVLLRRFNDARLIVGFMFAAAVSCRGSSGGAARTINPQEIIQKFAAKEAEFRKARNNYTYRQTVKIEELDPSGNVEGKWEIDFGHHLRARKQRIEKVVYAPVNTLQSDCSPLQDEQDLRNVQPFVLTTDDIGNTTSTTWARRMPTRSAATCSR